MIFYMSFLTSKGKKTFIDDWKEWHDTVAQTLRHIPCCSLTWKKHVSPWWSLLWIILSWKIGTDYHIGNPSYHMKPSHPSHWFSVSLYHIPYPIPSPFFFPLYFIIVHWHEKVQTHKGAKYFAVIFAIGYHAVIIKPANIYKEPSTRLPQKGVKFSHLWWIQYRLVLPPKWTQSMTAAILKNTSTYWPYPIFKYMHVANRFPRRI